MVFTAKEDLNPREQVFLLKMNKSVHIPILMPVCNNISMKNVIKLVKSVKLLNVKLFNQLNDSSYMYCKMIEMID